MLTACVGVDLPFSAWGVEVASHLLAFAVAACLCGVLVLMGRSQNPAIAVLPFGWRRGDTAARQAAHLSPTPRIGGLAVFAGFVVGGLALPEPGQTILLLLAIAGLPILLAGLLEDLGVPLSPTRRLLAAALGTVLAMLLFQSWLSRADIPGVDSLLSLAPFSFALTMFVSVGFCHAFNLVDGLNGLAAAIGLVAAACLGSVAFAAGQPDLAMAAFVLFGALAGFFLFNYPFAKIFLGDSGACVLGFLLTWLAMLLVARVPEVSVWAMVLIFFWPVADTALAIWRRRGTGRAVMQPDRLHAHQLMLRMLELCVLGSGRRRVANPLATALLVPLFAAPAVMGALLWNKPAAAVTALLACTAVFVGSYIASVHLLRRRPHRVAAAVQPLARLSGLRQGRVSPGRARALEAQTDGNA